MTGLRVCYENAKTHEEIPHYDFASNIEYDKSYSKGNYGNVQQALDELYSRINSSSAPTSTIIKGGAYLVDLDKYNITEGDIEKDEEGHYSEEQYALMYKNCIGFTNAISDGYNQGYKQIVFPKGYYCFIPVNSGTLNDPSNCIWILNINTLDIDLGGSTLELKIDTTLNWEYQLLEEKNDSYKYSFNKPKAMYTITKSVTKNSREEADEWAATYATSSTLRRNCHAHLIWIGQSSNIQLHNAIIKGDLYTKTFEKFIDYQAESSYGIAVTGNFTYNIKISAIDVSGFDGDGITSHIFHTYVYVKPAWYDWSGDNNPRLESDRLNKELNTIEEGIAGNLRLMSEIKSVTKYDWFYDVNYNHPTNAAATETLDTEKVYKSTNTNVYDKAISPFICLKLTDHDNIPDYVRTELFKRIFSIACPLGNNHWCLCYPPCIEIVTFCEVSESDNDDNYVYEEYNGKRLKALRLLQTGFGDEFQLYPNETYVRVQTYYSGLEVNETYDTKVGYIRPRLNRYIDVVNCYIHDNFRGAISGGANEFNVINSVFSKQAASDAEVNILAGSFPRTALTTDYILDFEDAVSIRATIIGCTFFSDRNYGFLLFPRIGRLDFLNNVCYGCIPSTGYCYDKYVANNRFYNTAIYTTGSTFASSNIEWRKNVTQVEHYHNNTYYNARYTGIGHIDAGYKRSIRVTSCYIECAKIDSAQSELNMTNYASVYNGEVEEIDEETYLASKQDLIIDSCVIKVPDGGWTRWQLGKISNSIIYGGKDWYAHSVTNCEFKTGRVLLLPFKEDRIGNILPAYFNNVKGIDLNSTICSLYNFTKLEGADSNTIIKVYYNNCDIKLDVTNQKRFVPNTGFRGNLSDIYHYYNNCIFTKPDTQTSNLIQTITNNNEEKITLHLIFRNCDFTQIEGDMLAGNLLSSNGNALVDIQFIDCDMSPTMCIESRSNSHAAVKGKICYSKQGTTANRPQFVPKGHLYFDTDLNKLVVKTNDMNPELGINTVNTWVEV